MGTEEFRGDDYFDGYNEGYNEGFNVAKKFYLEKLGELVSDLAETDIGDVP